MAVLKVGSKGGGVKKLQQALNKAGAKPPLKVDGVYGPKTKQAVLDFQGKHKDLKRDGVAGKDTVGRLAGGGDPKAKAGGDQKQIAALLDLEKKVKKLDRAAYKSMVAYRGSLEKKMPKVIETHRKQINDSFELVNVQIQHCLSFYNRCKESVDIDKVAQQLSELAASKDKQATFEKNKKAYLTMLEQVDLANLSKADAQAVVMGIKNLQANMKKANDQIGSVLAS